MHAKYNQTLAEEEQRITLPNNRILRFLGWMK